VQQKPNELLEGDRLIVGLKFLLDGVDGGGVEGHQHGSHVIVVERIGCQLGQLPKKGS